MKDEEEEKMKDERSRENQDEKRRQERLKNVSEPSNLPDELAQNVSKNIPSRTNYSSIFPSKVQNLAVFELFTGFEFDFSGRRN